MEALFLKMVNLSLTASWLVLAIMLFRLLLRKAPKWINCLLWGLVGLRLICPFSMESIFSLIPSAEPLPEEILYTAEPKIESGIYIIDSTVNPLLSKSMAPAAGASANPTQIWSVILACVWLAGMAAMLVYTLVSYILLRRKVATATKWRDNIKECETVGSPFVLGLFRPTIYLPYGMNEEDREYVIAHEKAHIRRGDHVYKPLGFLLLSVYWFNPLLWVAYVLLCRDIEAACDEKVIGIMEKDNRRAYATALLNCSVHRRRIAACPLAFGEVGVKKRIRSVMQYKKAALWLVVLAVAAGIIVAVCFMTSPITIRNPWVQEYVVGAENILGTIDKEKYESVSEDFAIGADQYGRAVFKDPLKAFDTMKDLYSEGLKLIQKEEGLSPISHRNYGTYKKLGWQMTAGSAEARAQAAFISGFLDIYENSFTKDIPDTDPPAPTVADEGYTVLVSHISEETLDYDTLKQQQEEIWAYKKTAENDETDGTFRRWGAKITSVGANPGQNYVTVFVRDFGENDVNRFEKALGHCSYVLMQSGGGAETQPDEDTPIEVRYEGESVPAPVLAYATELVQGLIETYNGYGTSQAEVTGTTYTIADAKITSITPFETGTVGMTDGCYLYRMECYLKPDETDETNIFLASGMVLEDGWFKITQPYFAMYCTWESEEEVWIPLGIVSEQAVNLDYSTEEMLNAYGNPYTAAVMQMLEQYRDRAEINPSAALISVEEVDFSYLYGASYYRYIVEEGEYTRYFLIRAYQPIYDLRLTRYIPGDEGASAEELLTLEELTAYQSLILGLVFPGDLTTYGFSFADSQGNTYFYEIYVNHEDGSMLFEEVKSDKRDATLFGKPVSYFMDTAWEKAQETAREKGFTLDRESGILLHDSTGEYVGVEYYEQDGQRHVRVTFLQNEKGEYVTEPTEEETENADELLRPGTIDGAFGYASDGRPAIYLSEASKTYLDTKEEFMIINTSPFGVQKSSVEGLKEGGHIRITFITIADLDPRVVDAEKIEVIADGKIY